MPAWTGPPRSLIAATVAAFVLAPIVSSAGQDAEPPGGSSAAEQASLSSGSPTSPTSPSIPTAPVPPRQAEPAPVEAEAAEPAEPVVVPRTIGVATFNQFRKLTPEQLTSDARALARNPRVDVIGWQEAWDTRGILRDLGELGWSTRSFPRGAKELSVSWRSEDFTFVGAEQRQVARGVDDGTGRYPFGDRWAIRVTLRDKASGELISVLNTHLPQAIEDLENPGRWALTYNSARARTQLTRLARMWGQAPGRWVVGTGDYNVDAGAERRVRPEGGLSDVFAGRAVSSYAVLGTEVADTHPVSGRHIDYVHVSKKSLARGRVAFAAHWAVTGLDSDHRPLLARLRLS